MKSWFNLDYAISKENRQFSVNIMDMYISNVFFGGIDDGSTSIGSRIIRSLIGCIEGVDAGFGLTTWLSPTASIDLTETCGNADRCISDPCPKNSD